uniref:MARVEL domain-containing protein n=1 Tax=Steinernema glaseri TaxID=37863 RepID=A0A1I8AIC1_9BILA
MTLFRLQTRPASSIALESVTGLRVFLIPLINCVSTDGSTSPLVRDSRDYGYLFRRARSLLARFQLARLVSNTRSTWLRVAANAVTWPPKFVIQPLNPFTHSLNAFVEHKLKTILLSPADSVAIVNMDAYYNPEYQCCCGSMHVKTGTMVIAVISFVTGVFSVLYTLTAPGESAFFASFSVATAIIEVVFACLVIHGIKSGKAKMLMPFMAYQVFNLLQIAVLFVISFIGIFYAQWIIDNFEPYFHFDLDPKDKEHEVTIIRIAMICMVVGCLFAFFISIWFLRVVQKCYRYLLAQCSATASFMNV